MDDFISKPFSKKTLVDAVSRCGLMDKVTGTTLTRTTTGLDVPLQTSGADPTLDAAALDQIAELDPAGDGRLVVDIIETFVDNARLLLDELDDASTTADVARVTAASHSLKSSSANVGALRLARICSAVEKSARAGDIDAIAGRISSVRTELEAATAQLQARISEIAA